MRESLRACLTAFPQTKQFSTCSWTRPEWCQGHEDLEEGNSMTSDKPRRKLSVQLLLSDMQAQTGCQRQRIADEIDQTALQPGCSNPTDSVEQCFSGNETRTRTSCIWFWPWCRASGVDFSWECWCDRTAASSISAELLNAWRHPVYRWAQLTIHTADRCSNPIWKYESPNECMARFHWQRTSDWTELAKLIVRHPDELGDMTGEHQTCVDRDAETPDLCRCHYCAAVYCYWCRCRSIGQSSCWSEPYHFRFRWIEAQSIRSHPRPNPLHAGTETRAQGATVTRQTVLI